MQELSKVSIFEKLNENDVAKLGAIVTRKTHAPDTAVVFQGDPSDSLYILLSGSAKVHVTSAEGQGKILKILGAGEIFGELAMLDGSPRSATVTTLEPTEMAAIARRDFQTFVAGHPEILWKVIETLCERVRKTSAETLEMSSRDVPYRLLAALSQLAEKHGETGAGDSCCINLKLDVKDFAAMVGSNREAVSRLLHQYQEEGLIRLEKKGQIFIPSRKALAHALEYSSEW